MQKATIAAAIILVASIMGLAKTRATPAVCRAGWHPKIAAAMAATGAAAVEPLKQTPVYRLYVRIAPKAADWPVLLHRLDAMLSQDYD